MNLCSKRVTRIELATTAWKAAVLPLNYTRLLLKEMARDGIEPPTHGASIHCSTNWATEPNCGSRIWTYDLRVMSPTSYRAAPSRVNIKEDVGFEPTHAFTRLTVFKTVPFSRTWVILRIYSPYGIRTRVTAVKRRCLNPLTNGPSSEIFISLTLLLLYQSIRFCLYFFSKKILNFAKFIRILR